MSPSTAEPATPAAGPRARRTTRTARERGQVLVIFAGAMIALVALCAVVVDVAWYWTSNLRMQRAADAAALAGVVWLPGNQGKASIVARDEAAKNGYTNGVDGVVVTPSYDKKNPRRIKVAITGPVGTLFARAVGINSWPAARSAKADYVLPVPMGSPQNYYGVGFYEGLVSHTSVATGHTSCDAPSWDGSCTGNLATAAPSGGQWTATSGTIPNSVNSNNNVYATENTNGEKQQLSTFGLLSGGAAIPTPGTGQALTITGVEVRLSDAFVSATCSNSTIGVQLSWDAGTTWSTALATGTLSTNNLFDDLVGSSSSTTGWGAHTWVRNDFSDANFRVRLTANKGCGTSSTTLNLDQLELRVGWKMTTTTTTKEVLPVPDPATGSALDPQGFWGAMFTSGGYRENGDKYGPRYLGNGTGQPQNSNSPTYDAGGYDYTIELPGGNGDVRLFDPMFCATGDNGHGGSFGAGDHWTGGPATTGVAPVAISYTLYDTQETLLDTSDDAQVATVTYDPGSATMGDLSGAFGTPTNSTAANRQDCSANPAHNRWVVLKNGLPSATYRLNVNTSSAAGNLNVGAENLFSIWAKSLGNARVFGGGRMAAYTNLDGGLQKFYFAQIEKVHAGKTMAIHLFDPGEASGNAYLRILSPDGNIYHYQTFDWTSDDGRAQTGVSQIQTAVNGAAQFNNREITITIPLPATYGKDGLNPPGDVTDEEGWWLIEYNVNQGNDTTTWAVDIRGNPVHLVLP
jgi:Flp pilus assembly protein TadG